MLKTVHARLRPIVGQLNLPTVLKTAVLPNDTEERLFIATQVREIFYTDNRRVQMFLDIRSRIIQLGGFGGYDERGLLGLAFHPKFHNNGLFYLHYSLAGTQGPGALPSPFIPNPCSPNTLHLSWENRERNFDHIDTVEEWALRGAIPQKRRTLLNLRRPFFNHNGVNSLTFSPETGRLVLTTGDGGSAYDPFNLAQNNLEIAGKVIEIDIERMPFEQNPPAVTRFNELSPQTQEALTVIAKGVRNIPGIAYQWMNQRWTKYLGNVGQDLVESIFSFDQYIPIPVTQIVGSSNFNNIENNEHFINLGWRGWEGNLPSFILQPCQSQLDQKTVAYYEDVLNMVTKRIPPLASYYHQDPRPEHFSGTAITGVHPYSGNQLSELTGKIVFIDFARKLTGAPVRGILGYTEPRKGLKQNDVGLIDIGNPFGSESAYYTSLGANFNHTRLFLGVYRSQNVTQLHQGTIYEIVP